MNNSIQPYEAGKMVGEIKEVEAICRELAKIPKFKSWQPMQLYTAVVMSRSLGVDPQWAINQGMEVIQGKVEIKPLMMNLLIRRAGHSVTKDPKSTDQICILHGKRADTGDTWSASFSLEDAKRAGLMNKGTWNQYPQDMIFNRALSRLARQLFPDVIAGCYIEGEMPEEEQQENGVGSQDVQPIEVPVVEVLGEEGADNLLEELAHHPEYKAQVEKYLAKQEMQWSDLPVDYAEKIHARIEAFRGGDDNE